MFTGIEYDVEVGIGRFIDRELVRDIPMLRIPLVNNTVLGTAENEEEQALCQGGGLLDIEGTHDVVGRVFFNARVSYDGKKIIIPGVTTPGDGVRGLNVSPVHGELRLNDGRIVFYYRHLSKNGGFTSLFVPGRDDVASTNEEGAAMRLDFDASNGESGLEKILLLGGFGKMLKPEPIGRDYFFPFYYVRLIMTR